MGKNVERFKNLRFIRRSEYNHLCSVTRSSRTYTTICLQH